MSTASQVSVGAVTKRYADSLLGLARKKGVADAVREDVARLARELASPAVAAYLFDARVDSEERRAKLAPVLEGMQPLTQNFVHLLFDKHREEVLRDLGAAFHARTLEERGEAEGFVESARPLGEAELGRLADLMGRRLGKTVRLENRIVPELVGGVRVTVGSRMVDFSVQGRLEDIRRRMLEAALPSGSL